jgi:hypothetical protein
MNLIKVDIQFEYIHPLRCSLGYKSSTKLCITTTNYLTQPTYKAKELCFDS